MEKYYGNFSINHGSIFTCVPYLFTNKRVAKKDMREIALGYASPGDTVQVDIEDKKGDCIYTKTYNKK